MRLTRSSLALQIARRRFERLQSIQPPPDFGAGFSLTVFGTSIIELADLESRYNTTVSSLDAQLTEIKVKEREIRDFRERILTAIAFIYGKDSDEYVAAGGIRKSERKRPRAKMSSSTPKVEN